MSLLPLIYLVCAVSVVTLAGFSRDSAKFWLSIVLLWAWTAANFCVYRWGWTGAPLYLAWFELGMGILSAGIGYMSRSYIALIVTVLFGAQEVVQLGAFMATMQGSTPYYVGLNLVYIAQLLVVGGASVGSLRLDRLARIRQLNPLHLHSRAHRR